MVSGDPYMYQQNRWFFVNDGSNLYPIKLMHVDRIDQWAPTPTEKYRLSFIPKPSWKLSPLERAAQGRAAKAAKAT